MAWVKRVSAKKNVSRVSYMYKCTFSTYNFAEILKSSRHTVLHQLLTLNSNFSSEHIFFYQMQLTTV
jgi:hypothetical protein